MKKLPSILLLVALLAVMIPAAPVQAQSETVTVTLQPGAAGVKDAQIANGVHVNTNFGNGTTFDVGESGGVTVRSLIEFDLSGLPYDITVIGATLTLTVMGDYSDNARTMSAYGIINDWVESQVTWSDRKSLVGWSGAGATGADVDEAAAVGSVAVANNLAVGSTVVMTLDPAAVEAMGKQNYFGFKLQMDTENNDLYKFYSSDDATETNRPKLVIEYTTETPFVDPGWLCVTGIMDYFDYYNDECLPNPPGTTVPVSPFARSGAGSPHGNYGAPTIWTPYVAAKINCEPYPRCINDYPVYYRITMEGQWTAMGSTSVDLHAKLKIPGAPDQDKVVSCGTGDNGRCMSVWEGVLTIADLPVNTDGGYSIGFLLAWSYPSSWAITGTSANYTVYFSLMPFDQNCLELFSVPTPETFTIDPLIETPLGPAGSPADDQIYTTVIGQTYMVHVKDGPWNDGTTDRTDAAVSVDGTTWVSMQDFTATAECVSENPLAPGDDYRNVFFVATTETFYIRANDTAGSFANNSNNETTPYSYVIGEAFPLANVTCEGQFSYDPATDLTANVTINGTSTDTLASDTLQAGEWYAVQVASGTWSEPNNEPLITMEYVFGDSFGATWTNLAEGSGLVQCVTENNIVYVQANNTELHLRVDDLDNNFANNTGSLNVNIYHASFQRPSQTCELSFALNDLVRSDTVDAKQAWGKVFAMVVGTATVNQTGTNELFVSGGLVPGAWYALETTGGPWGYLGNLHGDAAMKYDLAIAQEPSGTTGTNDESAWGPLATWDMAACNVETDKLGHRMVYFQMPITGALQWKLRVNDLASSFNSNTGSMSWNLYRASDLGPTDSGVCDYSYDPANKVNQVVQTIDATLANGGAIQTGGGYGDVVPLVPNTYYAIELLGEDFKWYDVNGGDPLTEMELSLNNGQSWGVIPGGGELCAVAAGDNTIFYIHTGDGPSEYKLRVHSTSFDNNVGFMGYNVYTADAGTSINPWDGCVTQGYTTSTFGSIEWIPVKDSTGRGITAVSASYAEIAGLVPGNKYIVETNRGPWTDGETTFDNSTNLAPQWGAQVSADGGETWQDMDGTNPNVTCWEASQDFKYRKIEFTVQEGQDWRIRVADTASATFDDNEGQLAYTLKGLVLPADTAVTGTFNLAGCNTPAVSPGVLSLGEILNLGNFLALWLDYLGASVINFFAWCPENTSAVTLLASDLQTREPFAMWNETLAIMNDVKNEINGYNWGSTSTDFSILTKSPAQSAAMMEQYMFGELPADSPWMGGDLVDMTVVPEMTDYYATCQLGLAEYVGPKLGQGVCFASNWAKEVGFIFWIQLALDITIIFACIHEFFGVFKGLMYLATGVNFGKMAVTTVVNNTIERGRR
jgi:hypothetical protein